MAYFSPAGNREVVDEVFGVTEGIKLVLLILGNAFAPKLYLVDGIFHLVFTILALGAVDHAVAWESVGGSQLVVGPVVRVAVGLTKLLVIGGVFRVVHHFTRYLWQVVDVPMVGIDVTFY